jgi:transcriptional regulator with XRE-family HTH domain
VFVEDADISPVVSWSAASGEEAARRAGVSSRYFSRLESKRHDPSLTTLAKIAKAFGLSVSQLLE